jgi:hypothetical protein
MSVRKEWIILIQEHKFNLELSREMYGKHSIEIKECYKNVFNVISHNKYKKMFLKGELRVAYGCYLIHVNLMARHCFFN